MDDIIDKNYSLGTESQLGKLWNKSIVDLPSRIVVYIIDKVEGNKAAHLTGRPHFLYAL